MPIDVWQRAVFEYHLYMTEKRIRGGTAHRLPADMRTALAKDSKALATWNDITPLARNEWICWTISGKKTETRVEHVEQMRDKLKQGIRRPCCWIGCVHRTDKAISPSITALLEKKGR